MTDKHTPTYGETVDRTVQLQYNTLTKMHHAYVFPLYFLHHVLAAVNL